MGASQVRDHAETQIKTAGTNNLSFQIGPVGSDAGNLLVARIVFDNLTATTPVVSSIAKPGGETASWVKVGQFDSATAGAGSGLRGEVWVIKTTVAWAANSTYVITLSGSVTAKACQGREYADVLATLRSTSGTNATTSGNPSATTTGTAPQPGDLVLGFAGWESRTAPVQDTDTTGGVQWSAGSEFGTSGGSGVTNVIGLGSMKIPTSAGHQTYNPTGPAGDAGACIVALQGVASTVQADTGLQQTTTMSADGTRTASAASTLQQTTTMSAVGTSGVPLEVAGVFGAETSAEMSNMSAIGVSHVMVPAYWDRLQPSGANTALDSTQLAAFKQMIADAQTNGLRVVLGFGIHYPPAWAKAALPKYKDQTGTEWSSANPGEDVRDWTFDATALANVKDFMTRVMNSLTVGEKARIDSIRCGWGFFGELQYPRVGAGTVGLKGNEYQWWGFSDAAKGTNLAPDLDPNPAPTLASPFNWTAAATRISLNHSGSETDSSTWTAITGTVGNLSTTPAGIYDGTKVVSIQAGSGAPRVRSAVGSRAAVTPGETITARGMLAASAGRASYFGIEFYDSGGGLLSTVNDNGRAESSRWTAHIVEAVVPASAATVGFIWGSLASTTQTFYGDAFRIESGASPDIAFANWYRESASRRNISFIRLLREECNWKGLIHVLHPSFGLRVWDDPANSQWKPYGRPWQEQMAAGVDWNHQMTQYKTIPGVFPWNTWMNNEDNVPSPTLSADKATWRYMKELAVTHGLTAHLWGENTGGQTDIDMQRMFNTDAIANGYNGIFWLDYAALNTGLDSTYEAMLDTKPPVGLLSNVSVAGGATALVQTTTMSAAGTVVGNAPGGVSSGLVFWARADELALADAAAVAAFPNKLGGLVDFVQNTVADRPTYRTNRLNGRAGMEFDGTTDHLDGVSAGNGFSNGKPGMTLIAVLKDASGILNGPGGQIDRKAVDVSNGLVLSNTRGALMHGDAAANDFRYQLQGRRLDADAAANQVSTAKADTSPHIEAAVYDTPNALAHYYVDGTAVISNFAFQTAGSYSATDSLSYKIGQQASGSQFWNGDVYEVLIFDRALSSVEVTAITDDLKTFYGLAAATQQGAATLQQTTSLSAGPTRLAPAATGLSQSTTLTAGPTRVAVAATNFQQTQTMSAAGVITELAATALSQTQILSAAGVRVAVVAATLAQTQVLSATASGIGVQAGAATLAQSQALSAAATVTDIAALSLTQSTVLAVAAVRVQPGAANLQQTQALSAVGLNVAVAAGVLAQGQTLTAAATRTAVAQATLQQQNTLSATAAGVGVLQGAAALQQTQVMSAAGLETGLAATTLTQSSTMSAAAIRSVFGTTTFQQTTTLSSQSFATRFGAAALSQTQVLSATVGGLAAAFTTLTQSQTMSAAGLRVAVAGGTFSQNQTLTVSAVRVVLPDTTLQQPTSLSVGPVRTTAAATVLQQAQVLSATVGGITPAAATLTQTNSMSAVGVRERIGAVNLVQTQGLSSAGLRVQTAAATLTQTNVLTGFTVRVQFADVLMVQGSAMVPSGRLTAYAGAALVQEQVLLAAGIATLPYETYATPAQATLDGGAYVQELGGEGPFTAELDSSISTAIN